MPTITGTSGNDVIDEAAAGGSATAASTINALAGNDRIIALRKTPGLDQHSPMIITDAIDGGDGIDTYEASFTSAWSVTTARLDHYGGGTHWYADFTSIEQFDLTAWIHGTATLGSGNDRVDVRLAGSDRNGNYNMGAGDDEALFSRGTATVDMGAGSDRLVIDHAYANARTVMSVALSGDLASGYSGTYYRSDGAGVWNQTHFSGVEHFTITTVAAAGSYTGDNIVTGDGNDIVSTGAGDDLITVARGDDAVDGGTEVDGLSIDLSDESAGVTINLLAAGAQQTGGTGSITNVETFAGAVVGTAHNDVLIEGVHHYNAQFSTGAGDDLVQVSRGTDSVAMGAGSDRLVLEHSTANARTTMLVALSGDLASGYSGTYYRSDGAGVYANVSFSGVEHFTITTSATGSYTGDNIVTGDGNDTVSTGAGDDLISVARGTDAVDGGTGVDGLSIDLSDESTGVTIDLLAAGAQQTGGTGSIAGVETFAGAVVGSAHNDVFIEGVHHFNAQFSTGAGDDIVQLSRGTDSVAMGDGSDRLVLEHSTSNARTSMLVALSGDLASGYSGTYYRSDGAGVYANVSFSGVEHFTITTSETGSYTNDTITTGDGNDTVSTGAGDDLITVGRGADAVDGGTGVDALNIDLSDESTGVTIDLLVSGAQQTGGTGSVTGVESFTGTVLGSAHSDVLREGNYAFNAEFETSAGNDLVQVSRGNDVVNMGTGSDRLVVDYSHSNGNFYGLNQPFTGSLAEGYSGQVYLGGGAARTTFSGVEHFTITSAGGNDHVVVGDGDDVVSTGAASDRVAAGNGTNDVDGGDGIDSLSIDFSGRASGVTVDLLLTGAQQSGGAGSVANFESFEGAVTGTGFNDVFREGNHGYAATFETGAGDDLVQVMRGNDVVNMGAGSDRLVVDWSHSNGHFYGTNQPFTGSLGAGYSGQFYLGGGAAQTTFSGVEHFTISTGGSHDTITVGDGNDILSSGLGADTINAGGGNDSLDGGGGNDRLDGGAGIDAMTGGAGDDIYFVDETGDTAVELADEGTDRVESSATFTLGANVENLVLTGTAAINGTGNTGNNAITGNSGANTLSGGGGDDTLDGGLGADEMNGGTGNDLFVVDDAGDVVTELAGGGTDTVRSSIAYTLDPELENLTLTGTAAINGTGNAQNNVIIGNSAANSLYGNDGNDTLDGGLGGDRLSGGDGDDSYVVDNTGDRALEGSAAGGNDTVYSSVSYDLAGQHIETLVLTGARTINATGNSLANTLVGNSGGNILDGGGGSDAMSGGLGNDTYYVDVAGDTVTENSGEGTDHVHSAVSHTLSANVENLTLTGLAAIDGFGNALNNVLTGNAAANRLEGGAGADTLNGGAGGDVMIGGANNDIYVVDSAGDTVTEIAGGGVNDTVQASIGYTLTAEVETLYLTGTAAINGTGNALDNYLYGNSGNNILNGLAGADRMNGGNGDDTYYVDNIGDTAVETSATGGIDTVRSSVSFSLAYQNLERLFLTGTASINATGNSLNNTLVGNSGNNILDGMGGVDVMNGGAGDDTYIVDSSAGTVIETAGGGIDTVLSSATFALSPSYEIENLTLTGFAAVNAYGNHLANNITGNDNNNILNGSTGADTMTGKGGTDTYFVDNAGDMVVELAGGGVDTVHSSVSYTLSANVENLGITGSATHATGNALSNRLYGNAGNNVLDGGAGADYMTGRGGNDTYIVDNVGDRVLENSPGDGTADKILASVTYSLGGIYIETLELTGSAAIDATGNSLANTLIGNSGANELYGKGGNDTLSGGGGADGFFFDTALNGSSNVDAILDFSVADDTIFLRGGVFSGIAADGTLASGAFAQGTAAQDADDRIVYDSATGRLWYDADGSGAGAAVLFATVTAGTALTHLDFSVYTPG